MHRVSNKPHLDPASLFTIHSTSSDNYRFNAPQTTHIRESGLQRTADCSSPSRRQLTGLLGKLDAARLLSSSRLQASTEVEASRNFKQWKTSIKEGSIVRTKEFNSIGGSWGLEEELSDGQPGLLLPVEGPEPLEDFNKSQISLCYALCKVSQKGRQLTPIYSLGQTDIQFLNMCSDEELFALCKKSQTDSIKVQSFLEFLGASRTRSIFRMFTERVEEIVTHPTGSYIGTWLVTNCEDFKLATQSFCLSSIDKLVTNKCAVKVMQALAGVSKTFCKAFNNYFRRNYCWLSKSKQASIVMNTVIVHLEEEKSLDFLVSDIAKKFSNGQQPKPEVLRVLSSLLERCRLDKLSMVVSGAMQHIWWLVGDKIGNYSVQALLSGKFRRLHSTVHNILLSDDVASLVTDKYKQIVVLRSLEFDGQSDFHCRLLSRLMLDPAKLRAVLECEISANLLVALLSVCEEPLCHNWIDLLLEAAAKTEDVAAPSAPGNQNQSHLLQIIFKLQTLRRLKGQSPRSLYCPNRSTNFVGNSQSGLYQ